MPNYIWRHTWDSDAEYVVGDLVFDNGDSYLCKLDNVGEPVTTGAYWRLINRWNAPVISKKYVASTTIPPGRAVSLDSDGKLILADMTGDRSVIGITAEMIATDEKGLVTTFGYIERPEWSFTPGKDVYLGKDGQLTFTVPTSRLLYPIAITVTTNAMYTHVKVSSH